MEIKKDILWRVYLCFLGIVIAGFLVIGNAVYIQRVEGKKWRAWADSMQLKYKPIQAERGSIYSEDGNILSTSIPVYDVFIDFAAEGLREKEGKRFFGKVDSLCDALAILFPDKSSADYKNELVKAYREKNRYFPLKKKISFSEYKLLRDFPLVKDGRNKSGFIFKDRDKRINPYVLLANRTIGLSRSDTSKNVGLEKSYDSVLRGTGGQRLVRYSAGALLPVEGAEIDPVNGRDIVTTLDTYIQDVAEDALMKKLVENQSQHGTVIVMETKTGKIKAIANLGRQDDGSYTEDYNYGVAKRTEPGSIFKLATLLALLEDKYVTINSKVDCEGGSKYFYGLKINDSHGKTGTVSVKTAFAISSNVAFAKLADQYYHHQPSRFTDHLHRFRLDTLTGIDVSASSGSPIIYKPTSKYWHATSIPYMAHGYGELVTPLNMLMLYNAVANNGRMMKPYLVNSIKEYGVEVKHFEPEVVVQKICSDETIAQAKECLRAVVDSADGTAHKILFNPDYSISGKTGTAVSADDNNGYRNGAKVHQASFIGYFPSEDPKYTIAVVVKNTSMSKNIYGNVVAGPVFKEISDKIYSHFLCAPKFPEGRADSGFISFSGMKNETDAIFNYFNIRRQDSSGASSWKKVQVNNKTATIKACSNVSTNNSRTPDVTGMGLKDALYVLENRGFRTMISGRGRVVSQSIPPGTAFNKGQKIAIQLN